MEHHHQQPHHRGHTSTAVENAYAADPEQGERVSKSSTVPRTTAPTLRSCPEEEQLPRIDAMDLVFIQGLRPSQKKWWLKHGDHYEDQVTKARRGKPHSWHLDLLDSMGVGSAGHRPRRRESLPPTTANWQRPPTVEYEWNPSPSDCDPSAAWRGGSFLFVWLGALNSTQVTDFLATFDADPRSPRYGQPVATESTPALDSMPHHGAYWLAPTNYAPFNSFGANRSWMFDLNQPCHPKLVREMLNPQVLRRDGTREEVLSFPHSFYPLGNGDFLGSFQEGRDHGAGGLAQYTRDGVLVRWSSAYDPKFPDAKFRTYGIAVLERLNRVVTTNFAMNPPPASDLVQVWQLSSLQLLSTLQIPPTDPPGGNSMPFELCPLPDKKSVAVFSGPSGCIWRVSQLDDPEACPHIALVGKIVTMGGVSVPICLGDWILVAVEGDSAVVVLDASDSTHIVEHARLQFPPAPNGRHYKPHMLSYDAFHSRVAVLDFDPMSMDDISGIIYMTHFDWDTGKLTLDPRWKVNTREIKLWPSGQIGGATGHAAVFSNPPRS